MPVIAFKSSRFGTHRRTLPIAAMTGLVLLLGQTAEAATVTVTTAVDNLVPNNGSVSLREAITAINAGNDLGDPDITAQAPGTFGVGDTINFNIAGIGVQTINVGADLSASGIPLPTI